MGLPESSVRSGYNQFQQVCAYSCDTNYQQLNELKTALQEKRPAMFNRKDTLLFHDNARPHAALGTRQKVAELGWEILSHPPYYPDLVPSELSGRPNTGFYSNGKYLIKKNKHNKYFLIRKKDDTDKQFLNRITHLPLQNQFIEQIMKISDCENVKALYLQNNLLKNIENMENFPNLTHLYLQRNFLVKMENLNVLTNLKKIYLGHNEIQVLEGMEDLKNVREIHLECQDIPAGGSLYFEPLTVRNLGETLHMLNISGNYLTSIKGLKNLFNLGILNAKDNLLVDIEDITSTISEWRFLQKLTFIGNEVTKNRWYRDGIIFASKSLEILDNVPIHKNTRIFIEKLIQQKKKFYMKHKSKTEDVKKEKRKTLKFADEKFDSKEGCFDFINSFPPPGPVYVYPAWRLRSNVNSVNPTTFLPRPYWKKGGLQTKRT